jgi:menaquinol-cytochrome c reductase iron-sulfur subunit
MNDTIHNSQSNTNENESTLARRELLIKLSFGVGALAAAAVGIPILGFLLSPLIREPPQVWRIIGPVDNFKVNQTVPVSFQDTSPLPWAGVTAESAAWLRRDSEDSFTAFSVNCTHLGCPVRWLGDAELFMCPCHGGVYYDDGTVAAGPPPKPLPTYPVRIRNGQVEILTSPIPITT